MANTNPKSMTVLGWIFSIFCILFLLFDGITKMMKLSNVVEVSTKIGIPESIIFGIGLTLVI